jgi:hypothetical protein
MYGLLRYFVPRNDDKKFEQLRDFAVQKIRKEKNDRHTTITIRTTTGRGFGDESPRIGG